MYSWQRCKLYIGFVQRCWFLMYFVQRCKMSMCFLQRCQLYMCLVQRCIFQMYFKQRWLCAMCFMQRSDLTCMSRRIGYESENQNANPIKICYLFVKWLLNIVVNHNNHNLWCILGWLLAGKDKKKTEKCCNTFFPISFTLIVGINSCFCLQAHHILSPRWSRFK